MTSLEIAITKTLVYADIFDHALTTTELRKYLIGYSLTPIDNLPNASLVSGVQYQDELWTLANRANLISLKKSQIQHSQYKKQQAIKWVLLFKLLPWIKLVGITGSVAGGTPRHDDDIDLIIITDPNRLWLSRLFVTLLLNLIGKRRKPHAAPNRVNNKFCLNMWLSTDNLLEKHQDLYVANELARLIPILNRQHTYERYLQANAWAADYLPNSFQLASTLDGNRQSQPASSILHSLNNLAEKLQRKIMEKPTIETVQTSRLAFHPHDYRAEILQNYRQRLSQSGINE